MGVIAACMGFLMVVDAVVGGDGFAGLHASFKGWLGVLLEDRRAVAIAAVYVERLLDYVSWRFFLLLAPPSANISHNQGEWSSAAS